MSKKVDKSRKTTKSSKTSKIGSKAKKKFKSLVSESKDAAKQVKRNKQEIKKLEKQNKKLASKVDRGKYLGKYVIVNHFDANGAWAYYTNTHSDSDLLMEGSDNPSAHEIVNGDEIDDVPLCVFTTDEVRSFVNRACHKLSRYPDTTPELIKWAKRRLYGSVIPAYLVIKKAQYDENHGI